MFFLDWRNSILSMFKNKNFSVIQQNPGNLPTNTLPAISKSPSLHCGGPLHQRTRGRIALLPLWLCRSVGVAGSVGTCGNVGVSGIFAVGSVPIDSGSVDGAGIPKRAKLDFVGCYLDSVHGVGGRVLQFNTEFFPPLRLQFVEFFRK